MAQTEMPTSPPKPLNSLPRVAGLGLRPQHMGQVIDTAPEVAWWEIHSENFLAAGGPRMRQLDLIAARTPISCHGVGLSLASADGVSDTHLARLRGLFDRVKPASVSEHLAWVGVDGAYLNDLLPIPYTAESLQITANNVDRAQQAFGRRILVENPSSYIAFEQSSYAEWDFLVELVHRTGCGLLLDVNNIHVSAHNHHFSAERYLNAVPLSAVGEIHVAGHLIQTIGSGTLLIDDHGGPVSDPVWDLLRAALLRLSARPVLVEWDNNLPSLDRLLEELRTAERIIEAVLRTALPAPAHRATARHVG